MEEISTLVIRVKSEDVDAAKKRLGDLTLSSKNAETATGGLTKSWKAFTAVLASTGVTVAAVAGLQKLVTVAKQFESLEAQLKTATGSAENAAAAFEAIQDFATQTPYDLAQSTDAFIKLVNLGLNPSERALRSYGNTASAMGKTLEDMTLAVSNATVGQFINLRQFGIKAETTAEGIAFTFRGSTTMVKNSAKDIENYFISLGETNFAGAMLERMNTLEGKISNLGDAWDVMFATISKAGAGELMKDGIDLAIAAIEEFTSMVGSGQLAGYIDAIIFKFESLTDGVIVGFQALSEVVSDMFRYWGSEGAETANFIIDAFKNMPENIRAYVQVMGARFGALVGYAEAIGKGIYDTIAGWFDYLIATATNVGKEIADQLKHPFSPGQFDYIKAQAEAYDKFAARAGNAFKTTVEGLDNVTDAFEEEVTSILNERDAALSAFKLKIDSANALREAYNKLKEARKAAGEGTDRLEKFRVSGTGTVTEEFRKLQETLNTQAGQLQLQYNKRKQLIIDNTDEEGSLRYELLNQLERQYGDERKQLLDKTGLDLEVQKTAILDAQAVELAMLQKGYEEKQQVLDDALEAKVISEEEYNRRSKQLKERNAMEEDKITREHIALNRTKQLNAYSEVLGLAGNIAEQLGSIAAKGTAASKAAYVAAKAIAIAQAIVYTELAAVRALAEGGTIAGIPLSTAIRALGYASVGIMAAQAVAEYSQHEHGGMIGAGKTGITQEAGFEFVRGPAVVTSARATADQLAGSGGNQTNIQVNVINQAGAQIETTERETPDGKIIDVLVRRVDKEIANRTRTGSSDTGKAMADVFGLRRGAA